MKIVLASNNKGKLAELRAMFEPLAFELVAQSELGIGEAAEPFHTFVENALAKARHASAQSGLPALADDAGLCVDAFGGLPGVDTAHYAMQYGYAKGDDNNVLALLAQMREVDNRRAALVSTLVAVRSPQDPEPLIAVGRVVGDRRDHLVSVIAPALRSRLTATDVLFLFARPGQSGPPVAAIRASASQLPLEFVLDDHSAMNPGNTLSQHKQVMLVARLSKSGNPMAQPGDLEGRALGVKVGANGVKLVIDQVLP